MTRKKRYYTETSYAGRWYNIYDRNKDNDIIAECDIKKHALILVTALNKKKKKK